MCMHGLHFIFTLIHFVSCVSWWGGGLFSFEWGPQSPWNTSARQCAVKKVFHPRKKANLFIVMCAFLWGACSSLVSSQCTCQSGFTRTLSHVNTHYIPIFGTVISCQKLNWRHWKENIEAHYWLLFLTEQSVPYDQNSPVVLVNTIMVPPCWDNSWWG